MEPDAIVELICLVAGVGISGLVSLAKRWSVVKNHPKWIVLGLSTLVPIISELTIGGLNWAELVACTLTPFVAAIGTHEVVNEVKKPLGESL